jgi:phosphoglycolate phosphatase
MGTLKIKESTIKTIIFDFDGTLAKLNIDFDLMRKVVLGILPSYNIDPGNLHSPFILEMIKEASSILGQSSPEKVETFLYNAYNVIEEIELSAANNGQLFNRTKELLSGLKSHNIAFAIITRNCTKAINKVFPDISFYCPVVISRNDVTNVKPNPEHINKTLQILKGMPQNTLMVGDHPLDIKTGRNAGTLAAGVLTGRCLRDDFIKAGADLVLPEASDILKMMN